MKRISCLNPMFWMNIREISLICFSPEEVRKAYNTLVFELNSAELVNTLGRATVSICDELMKHKIPTDDPETLCVFLVVFWSKKGCRTSPND